MGNYVYSLRRTHFKVVVNHGIAKKEEEISFHPYQYLFKPPDSDGDRLMGAAHAVWKDKELPKYVMWGGTPQEENHDLKYADELLERTIGSPTFNDGSTRKIGNVVGFVKWRSMEKWCDIEFLTCRDGLINNLKASCREGLADPQIRAIQAQIDFLEKQPNPMGFQDGDRLKERLLDFQFGYHDALMRLARAQGLVPVPESSAGAPHVQ